MKGAFTMGLDFNRRSKAFKMYSTMLHLPVHFLHFAW